MRPGSRAGRDAGASTRCGLFTTLGTVILVTTCLQACGHDPALETWSVEDLVTAIVRLERQTSALTPDEASVHLRSFAERAVRQRLQVDDGRVVSVYERGEKWNTRPYFALTYERDSYVYLEELDPVFQADLADHRFWASISRGAPDRQVMLEMALSRSDFERLQAGCSVDVTCELAAVIRGGKSVYCRALKVSLLDCSELEER